MVNTFFLITMLLALIALINGQNCTVSADCNHGSCLPDGPETWSCVCDNLWTDKDGGKCNYEQKSKLAAFLLSFFLGFFAIDWFYLSNCTGCYPCIGILKIITAGGLGIWWIIDWARILGDVFLDGNGMPLAPW